MEVRVSTDGDRFLGFGHGRLLSTSVWFVSSSKALMCIDLKEKWIA